METLDQTVSELGEYKRPTCALCCSTQANTDNGLKEWLMRCWSRLRVHVHDSFRFRLVLPIAYPHLPKDPPFHLTRW